MSRQSSDGHSLVELIFVAGMIATASGIAIPQMLAGLDDSRAIGATRYLSSRLHRARAEAVMRSADVAMQFVPVDEGGYAFAMYVDGNRNGIRSHDIERGVDRRLGGVDRLGDSFKGVEFGTVPDLPPVDPGGVSPGSDPIRLGASGFATFTALGTATPGSLYVRSDRGAQYVLRIFGETGKTRVLRFNTRTKQWTPL
jgi:type II secretory pathway pseudopilin PulG